MSELSLKKAAFITAISKYINIFLGILFSAVLSRILSPNDYGIVAIVTVFTTFFIVLSNCGLGIAVIQRKEFTQADINTLFSFSVYQGLALAGVFMLLAWPISIFFNDKVYIPICLILSISIFFNTVNAVPDGLLRKDKRFFLIALRLVIVTVFTYGITIVAALAGCKYYSLVIQSVASSVLIFLWNLKNVKVEFHFKLDKNTLKNISDYSGYNFLFNFVNYFTRNLDKMFIGKALGNEQLAQYNKAYHFMLYPVQNLTNVITPVLHPILSDFQNDTKAIFEKYMKIVKVLSLLGVFVTAICFTCSREIILILYGGQWNSAANCFHVLSLAIWTQMIYGTSGSIFVALGDTKKMFISSCISIIITVIALLIGTKFKSIETISFFIMIALNIIFIQTYFILIRQTMKMHLLHFLKCLAADFFILALCLTAGFFINKYIVIEQILLSGITKAIIISILYMVLMLIFRQFKYYEPVLPNRLKKCFRHF